MLKIIRNIFITFIVISMIGFIYESYSRFTTEIKPTGKLVDIGGYKLHYVKKGSGENTVVFESGSDIGGYLPWFRVQNEISKFATTISYDRAGLMWSERGKKERTANNMAEELHKLLEKIGAKKPYILVGHSLAGLILRVYVNKYPNDVKSVILIDPSTPKQNEVLGIKTTKIPLPIIDYANSIGLVRLFFNQNYPSTKASDNINKILKAMTYKGVNASIDEMNHFDAIAKEAGSVKSFNDIPLTVISGNIDDTKWIKLHDDLLKLSTNSKHIKVKDVGHYIQLEKPDIVINAIKNDL